MTNKVEIQSISTSSRWLQCTASLQYNKTLILNENIVKENLIHKVSALSLKENFFGENHEELIELLKTTDYKDNNETMITVRWDNDCDKISDSYIEYANKLYNQYEPHTVEIDKKINVTFYGYEKYGFVDLLMINDDYTIIVELKCDKNRVEEEKFTHILLCTIGVIQEQIKQTLENRFLGDYIAVINQPY